MTMSKRLGRLHKIINEPEIGDKFYVADSWGTPYTPIGAIITITKKVYDSYEPRVRYDTEYFWETDTGETGSFLEAFDMIRYGVLDPIKPDGSRFHAPDVK
ncbi:hypothetical protein EQG49_02435 [Periweissella cryptocerci]|uniref:Uncharacterized protein n=1 Tax=Periweissella cryptocerci TaxID=2506420 RepID=A0A4P6YS09_9LACO|nr:hypothetical protein [Periweissella cryptocerci]QBO35402.1 hypothetical protein EQG49_02435 [Periweissella cryptocerci]